MVRNNGHRKPTPTMMNYLADLSPQAAEQAEQENWDFQHVSHSIDALKNEQEHHRQREIWDIQEYDYDDNLDTKHPPLKWFIPDLLHVGLTQVSGAPKTGKSLQIMNMGLQLAIGLNSMTLDGSMLYLALEDNPRRIKQRGLSMSQGLRPGKNKLFIAHRALTIGSGLLEQLTSYLKRHPNTQIIVIDVLNKIKPTKREGSDIQAGDYKTLAGLQEFAHEHDLAILMIHHTGKKEWEDVFKSPASSNGNFGVLDASWILSRQWGTSIAYIDARSREFEDGDRRVTLQLDDICTSWRIEIKRENEPETKNTSINEREQQLLAILHNAPDGLYPREIAPLVPFEQVRIYLLRMKRKGLIQQSEDGRYTIAPPNIVCNGSEPSLQASAEQSVTPLQR